MAQSELTLEIKAKTSEFINAIKGIEAKTKVIANQMSEIDKQLKMENVDRVQKLSEKIQALDKTLNLARNEAQKYASIIDAQKKSLAEAEKGAEKKRLALEGLEKEYKEGQISAKDYEEQHKHLSAEYESSRKSVEKVKTGIELYSEKVKLAEQKSLTLAEQLKKTSDEFEEAKEAASKSEKEIDDLSVTVTNASESFDDMTDNIKEASSETEDIGEKADDSGKQVESFWDKLKQGVAINLVTSGLGKVGKFFADIAAKAWDAAKKVASFMKDYAKEAIDLAADYEDALGYSEQVFGNYSDNVQQWVKDNSVRLRINVADLQKYVNSMGSLYRSFGFEEQKAADLAQGLIDRAADLKSATGNEMQDIIKSLTSVMTGGYQAGYKYGVVINEASIKAYALSHNLASVAVDEGKVKEATLKVEKAQKKATETMWKYGEGSLEAQEAQLALEKASAALDDALGGQTVALTQAQKEEAIYRMLLEQTSHMAGQSAKESGNYKSQLDALKTTFDNLKISIGDKLLPVATDLIKKVNDFIASDAGQELLQSIVDSVEKLANKIIEMVEDGRFEEWMTNIKEKVPDIVDGISDFTDKVVELVPKIGDLVERLLALFGIETEAEKSRQALFEHRKEVDELAKSYDTSSDTIITAIAAFAEQNGLQFSQVLTDLENYIPEIKSYLSDVKSSYQSSTGDMWIILNDFALQNGISLKDVCDNWKTYEPEIIKYVSGLTSESQTEFDKQLGSFKGFAEENDRQLGEVLSDWQDHNIDTVLAYNDYVNNTASMEDAVIQEVAKLGPDTEAAISESVSNVNTSAWDSLWRGIKQTASDVWDFINTVTNPDAWENSGFDLSGGIPHAAGGPARAGHLYQVNDDHGRRKEMFVPYVDGYILNGNDTQRVINNSTNNSRTYGDMHIYVNSYGTDAASIADEIGAELNRRLRMSGA